MTRSVQEQKFADIYRAHSKHVYAYCRRRVSPDVVEDVVADVFLAVWRRLDQTPDGADVLRWIYGVAYRITSNHWRTLARRRRLENRLGALGVATPSLTSELVVVRSEVRDVMEAANRLRPSELEILRLSVWEKLSHEDIAQILAITPAAAKQRLYRARRKLTHEYERIQRQRSGAVSPKPKEVSGEL